MASSTRAFDLAVIGCGIVGAACARAGARAGLRTIALDREIACGGATAAGMGHIVVMDGSEAQLVLTHFSRQLWRQLIPELPEAAEYRSCGTLWIAADDEDWELARRKQAWFAARGVAGELLDAQQLTEAEPCLRPGLAGALRVPDDGVLYPPAAAQWLLRQAQNAGAEIRRGVTMTHLNEQAIHLAGGDPIAAGAIIVATGREGPELIPEIPLRPRKGHLLITDRYPDFLRHQLVELGYLRRAHAREESSVSFNLQPRATGQVLIGSSRQYSSNGGVEPVILGQMLARAQTYVPQLRTLRGLRAWTGFRAATPDDLPCIGPLPQRPHIYAGLGHEGLGITTSLGTAELLMAQIIGSAMPIPAEPYLPARFIAEPGTMEHV